MKRRFLSMLLALAILCTTIPAGLVGVSAEASDKAVLRPGSVGNLEKDSARIEKFAEATGNPNEYIITLTVEGKDITISEGADIVLVIDTSGSMSNSLSSMKQAAYDFVDQLLTKGSTNRISVVQYATNSSVVKGWTAYQAPSEGSREANSVIKGEIKKLTANGGTNTQAGIRTANQLLAESTASNKYLVLLSDGEPTYNYKPVFQNVVLHCDKDYGWFGSWSCDNTKVVSAEQNGYDYTKVEGSGSRTNYNTTLSGTCNNGRSHTNVRYPFSSSQAALDEAALGKAAGYTYYTIGYNVDDTTRELLKELASKDDKQQPYYFGASTSSIQTILKEIGNSITESIKDTAVVDPMGTMVNLVFSGSEPQQSNQQNLPNGGYYVTQGAVSYNKETETFSWQPGLVREGTVAMLRYKVVLDVEAPGFDMAKAYPANGTTTFTYLKPYAEESSVLEFLVPTVTGTYGTYFVRGYLVNEEGQPISSDGKVTTKENAEVVYGATAVINPRNQNNQWNYGTKTLSALSVTGYTLVGNETENVSITPENRTGTAWFAYRQNQETFTVEHYFQGLDGTFVKASPTAADSGSILYGESKYARDFVRNEIGFTYVPGLAGSVDTITYSEGSQTGLTLKLYYTRNTTDLVVEYVFEGGPKDSTRELRSPNPKLPIGSIVNAEDYLLDTTGENANYRYVSAEYLGLGENNTLLNTPGGKVILTYRYAEVTVQVIHQYPGERVPEQEKTHFLNDVITVSEVARPKTSYKNVLYRVTGTEITVGGTSASAANDQLTLSGNAVIVINYEIADAGLRIEYYFEQLDGTYEKSDYVQTDSIEFGQIKYASAYQITESGFTYNPAHPEAISSVSFTEGSAPSGNLLTLYYDRNQTTFTVEYYYQKLDGTYHTTPDATRAPEAFVFGQVKEAKDYLRNQIGFTYDSSAPGKVDKISYLTETPDGTVLKLFYKRNQTTFTVEHYYQNLDGTYHTTADAKTDPAVFQFGEEKLAADYLWNRTGFTYDSSVAGSITKISYLTETPSGTVLKLFYKRNQATFTVEHYYQNLDGTYHTTADVKTDPAVFRFGEEKSAADYLRNQIGFQYNPNAAGGISRISYLAAVPTGTVLKLYYTRNTLAFEVEHYFEQLNGTFVKADSTVEDRGTLRFGDRLEAADFVRTVADYTYDPTIEGSVTFLSYEQEPASGTVLKLYYTINDTDLTVEYHFIGGPKDNTAEKREPDPVLKVGSVVRAEDYLADFENYTYVSGEYSGLAAGNILTGTPGAKVILTYRYAEVNAKVIHQYPEIGDVDGRSETFFLNSQIVISEFGEPVTFYNGVLYRVSGTTITVGDQTVNPENDRLTLTGDAVIVIRYEVADAGFRVEHYFEQSDGSFALDGNVESGAFVFGQTEEASKYVRTVKGYTYNPNHADAVDRISFTTVDGPDGTTLKLYYELVDYTLTIQYVYSEGGQAAETYTETLWVDAPYRVVSPEIEDYTPDRTVVEGIMPDENVLIIVTYEAQEEFPDPTPPLVDPDNPTTSDDGQSVLYLLAACAMLSLSVWIVFWRRSKKLQEN